MDKNYIILMLTIFLIVFIGFYILNDKKKQKLKIEQKTSYLELQGYKRRLRNENALKYLDNDLLLSLNSMHSSKDDVRKIKLKATSQVADGKFIEDRQKEESKNKRNVWTGI